MLTIIRLCRNSTKKSNLVNYISTTIISRCDKPKNDPTSSENNDNKKQGSSKKNKQTMKLFESNIDQKEKLQAKEKLMSLLNKYDYGSSNKTNSIKVTQAKKNPFVKRPVYEAAKKVETKFELNVVTSVKGVADELGGDVARTETDLLTSLKGMKILKENSEESNLDPNFQQIKGIKPKINKLRGTINFKKELINTVDVTNDKNIKGDPLKLIDEILSSRRREAPLNIFNPKTNRENVKLKIWDELQQENLNLLVNVSPTNYFEQLILWTNQGKLWHFPINNEQGMEEEAKVDFTEHVFLEGHLEPWCPKKGPIRYFMELVLVGLSKNCYITVEDKKEHIYWFRDYFENKKKVLEGLGASASIKKIEEPQNSKAEVEQIS